ncbi:hypothetical protein B0H66DRAFT_311281 [Apodospora peruviana]|uniref:Zn(2)-C6 fungal-type domain-containing protein n=1 Tax=Apodospora peruviana TaxID=516989 RepID=A0AAE0I1W1_9PEZI|nr:hypothetical protein B0H66DRAFT_311281 [Apodospora peruviana]
MTEQSQREQREAELKRRKVRKGTHSCWECRRRKIRCQFSASNDTVCLPCQARGSACRSQEFADSDARPPAQPDRRMAQRLGRLEELMARLVDRILPETTAKTAPATVTSSSLSNRASPTPSASQDTGTDDGRGYPRTLDVLEAAVGDDTPVGLLLGLRDLSRAAAAANQPVSMPTPESDEAISPRKPATSKWDKTSRALHALFPSQHAINIITKANAGPYFLTSLFSSFRDLIEGKTENANSVSVVPACTSHPTVLARRLLQISICLQQLPPGYDAEPLQLNSTIPKFMENVVSVVSSLVTCIDEMVATAEGLESLVLLGLWHANAGNLRKAWLTYRRAMSLGQLMGIDRGPSRTLKFVDTMVNPRQRHTPEALWYRITACDRLTSLLLGLPAGDPDNSFATEEAMKRDTHMERLEKLHTVIASRIIERNANKSPSEAYAITQSIDCELENAANAMGQDWWAEPDLEVADENGHRLGQMLHLMLQVHHYDLLILLHLPYMLRNPSESRYDYSKATCARSSREVLKRFIPFRNKVTSVWACRHVDYSALVAAMTLLLSYLRQHQDSTTPSPTCPQRSEDRKLVEMVRERMQHVAVINQDRLTHQSADILGQMMPILDSIDASLMNDVSEVNMHLLKCLHLKVPYLGTVNFHPSVIVPAGKMGVCPNAGQEPVRTAAGMPTAFHDGSDFEQLQPQMASLSTSPDGAEVGATSAASFEGGPMQLELGSLDPALLPPDAALNGMFMDFDPQPQDGVLEFPDLMAGADDWIFQGVDTTYWSLLNGNNVAWG